MSHLSYTQNFFIYFVVIVAVLLVSLNFIFAIHAPYKEKKTPFECGYHSFLQNRIQFVISFFVFALLFLLFDLEIVLIYPFSVSIDINLLYGLILMIIFAGAVTSGFVFEFGKKALTIDSRQFNLKEVHMGMEALLVAINDNFSSFDICYKQAGKVFDHILQASKSISGQGSQKINAEYMENLRETFKQQVFMLKMNKELINEMMSYYKGYAQMSNTFQMLDTESNIRVMVDSHQFQALDLGNTDVPDHLIVELKQVIASLANKPDASWSEIAIEKLKPAFHKQTPGTISELLANQSPPGELSGSSSAEPSSSSGESTTFGPGLGIRPPSPSPAEVATGTTTPPKTFKDLPFR